MNARSGGSGARIPASDDPGCLERPLDQRRERRDRRPPGAPGSGIPWKWPLGELSGVLRSGWASSQTTARAPCVPSGEMRQDGHLNPAVATDGEDPRRILRREDRPRLRELLQQLSPSVDTGRSTSSAWAASTPTSRRRRVPQRADASANAESLSPGSGPAPCHWGKTSSSSSSDCSCGGVGIVRLADSAESRSHQRKHRERKHRPGRPRTIRAEEELHVERERLVRVGHGLRHARERRHLSCRGTGRSRWRGTRSPSATRASAVARSGQPSPARGR